MIDHILPSGISGADYLGDDPDVKLMPEEETALGQAVEGRRREFATARECAHRALSALGHPGRTPLLRGAQREPVWPSGIIGSITHCTLYRAAAVTTTERFWSVGIDAEPNAPLPPGILERISLPEERSWMDQADVTEIHWDRLIFSAKESVYKVWFPLTQRWLGFLDARIAFDSDASTFEAHLLHEHLRVGDCKVRTLQGRFLMNRGLLLTYIGIPRSMNFR